MDKLTNIRKEKDQNGLSGLEITVDFNKVSVIIKADLNSEQWIESKYDSDPYKFVANICYYPPVSMVGVSVKKNDN